MKSPQKMTAKILQDKDARDPLKVGIIGCGRLGSQLAHCLLTYGRVKPKDLRVSTRRPETLGKCKDTWTYLMFSNTLFEFLISPKSFGFLRIQSKYFSELNNSLKF